MKKYVCPCGYVYDPEIGDPDSGIKPGTSWDDVPEDWVCPTLCGIFNFSFFQFAEMWDLKMWDFIKSVLRFYTCFLWGCVYNPNSLTLR